MNSQPTRSSSEKAISTDRDIVVADMDHTLLACDLTVQSMNLFFRKKPYLIPALIFWYLQGRSVAKAKLAQHAMPDISSAPENQEVVSYLKAKRAGGAWIVLASASNEKIVKAVAGRFGFIDQAMGSVPGNTFKGAAKADGLDNEFGKGCYTYLGDSPADLPVWKRAKKAVTVGASPDLRARAEAVSENVEHIALASKS